MKMIGDAKKEFLEHPLLVTERQKLFELISKQTPSFYIDKETGEWHLIDSDIVIKQRECLQKLEKDILKNIEIKLKNAIQ